MGLFRANNKRIARSNLIHALSARLPYAGKQESLLNQDQTITPEFKQAALEQRLNAT